MNDVSGSLPVTPYFWCAFVTLHTFLLCLHNCFFWCRLTVPGPGAPGGSPARRQAARPGWGHAESCRVSEVFWLALNCSCWRWKSIRLYTPPPPLTLSLPLFYLSICVSLSPCSPQHSASPLPLNLSCSQVERQRRHREETGEGV